MSYQNYEQPCKRSQNSDFQSPFSASKIERSFSKKKNCVKNMRLKTGYLKRSQRYELAILRPFLAIFPQTTLRTFTKVKFWRTFWGAKHV